MFSGTSVTFDDDICEIRAALIRVRESKVFPRVKTVVQNITRQEAMAKWHHE